MKSDITRSTFNKSKKYVKVNAQQGKVQVDADLNEQIDIQEHHDTTTLSDIIGKTGTPIEDPGFEITANGNGDYNIGRGRYYVDGILCENGEKTDNDQSIDAKKQEDLPDWSSLGSPYDAYSVAPNVEQGYGLYVVYLDVWQRHITYLEDPDLREVALGGADTTTRMKTVWQAKVWPVESPPVEEIKVNTKIKNKKKILEKRTLDQIASAPEALKKFLNWISSNRSSGKLLAQVARNLNFDRCLPSPEAGYSGDENRLYRVEIHPKINNKTQFKWSRENASVAVKIVKVENGPTEDTKLITIQNNGKDDRSRLGEGQWIEVTDDYHELWNIAGRVVQIVLVEETTLANQTKLRVSDVASGSEESLLSFNPPDDPTNSTSYVTKNPKVRRWNTAQDKWSTTGDSTDTSDALTESPIRDISIGSFQDLEDGIQIQFWGGNYVPGDYWLIPARTITRNLVLPVGSLDSPVGSLDWPVDVDTNGKMTPIALSSAMEHHYCPLALVNYLKDTSGSEKDKLEVIYDYRDFFSAATSLLSLYYVSGDGQEATQDSLGNLERIELVVGVAVGGIPLSKVPSWKVQICFSIVSDGEGLLFRDKSDASGNGSCIMDVDVDGQAHCFWKLDSIHLHQQVEVKLVNISQAFGSPLHFNATLPISFYYVSGDGQEITPRNVKNEKTGEVTPILLRVGALISDNPLLNTSLNEFNVKFEIVDDTGVGQLSCTDAVPIEKGFAECDWTFLVPDPEKPRTNGSARAITPGKQQVKATLFAYKSPIELPPVYFNATFALPSLYYVSGDGQEVKQESDDKSLPADLEARIEIGGVTLPNSMLRLWKVKVLFSIMSGTGNLTPPDGAPPDELGIAKCQWTLDGENLHQQVKAALVADEGELFGQLLFYNALLVPQQEQVVNTSGIVLLGLPNSSSDRLKTLISEPIEHGQKSTPAVILGLLPGINKDDPDILWKEDNLGSYVCDFEDFCLYDWSPKAKLTLSVLGTIQCGGTLNISGTLVGVTGHVNLTVFDPNCNVTGLGTDTDANGNYSVMFTPPVSGLYQIIATFVEAWVGSSLSAVTYLEVEPASTTNQEQPKQSSIQTITPTTPKQTTPSSSPPSMSNLNLTPNQTSSTIPSQGSILYGENLFRPFLRVKAVSVDLTTFRILCEPPYPDPNWNWYIQWWAIPAKLGKKKDPKKPYTSLTLSSYDVNKTLEK